MYWGGTGKAAPARPPATACSKVWYFAEGSRGGEYFANYFLLFNPTQATIQATRLFQPFRRTRGGAELRHRPSSASPCLPTPFPSWPAATSAPPSSATAASWPSAPCTGARTGWEAPRQGRARRILPVAVRRRAPHRRASRPSIWSSIRIPRGTVQATFLHEGGSPIRRDYIVAAVLARHDLPRTGARATSAGSPRASLRLHRS